MQPFVAISYNALICLDPCVLIQRSQLVGGFEFAVFVKIVFPKNINRVRNVTISGMRLVGVKYFSNNFSRELLYGTTIHKFGRRVVEVFFYESHFGKHFGNRFTDLIVRRYEFNGITGLFEF